MTDLEIAMKEREERIRNSYLASYPIEGDFAHVVEHKVHVTHLPTVDVVLRAKSAYPNAEDLIGTAMYRILKECGTSITGGPHPRLRQIYRSFGRYVNREINALKSSTEFSEFQNPYICLNEFDIAFGVAFGKSFHKWRRSMKNSD